MILAYIQQKLGVDLSEPDLHPNHGLLHALLHVTLRGHKPCNPRIHVILVKASEMSGSSSGNSQMVCTCRPCCLHHSIVM